MYTDVLNESVILTLRPGTSLQSGSLFTTAATRRRSRSLFWGHAQSLHTPLSCPSVRLPACLPACLPFLHRRQALVCEFSFSKPRVCLFSEIPDYIQLMFFTTSTTCSSSSLLEVFFFSNRFKTTSSSSSSPSTTNSKLFLLLLLLLLLLQQQIQNYFFFFFFFNNRFKIISSSSSSSSS
jgi:hypothetical protein